MVDVDVGESSLMLVIMNFFELSIFMVKIIKCIFISYRDVSVLCSI